MHAADGSEDVVTAFDVVDGVLRYPPGPRPTALCCTAGALRAALAALGADGPPTVAFAPHGTEPLPSPGVTAVPVTDAVKRVARGRVVATVDRTALRYVLGPATVERARLDALLHDVAADDDIVHPLRRD